MRRRDFRRERAFIKLAGRTDQFSRRGRAKQSLRQYVQDQPEDSEEVFMSAAPGGRDLLDGGMAMRTWARSRSIRNVVCVP
jgi:hypothetical protein